MPKAYFSFCYNGTPPNQIVNERTNVTLGKTDEEFIDYCHKYAFVVETKKPKAAFAELSREPLFRRLLGPVLFGWHEEGKLVIGSIPDMATSLVDADMGAALQVKTRDNRVFVLPVRKLERMCINPIKFGLNCMGCPKYTTVAAHKCYFSQLLKYAEKSGVSFKQFLPPERVPADDFHPPDLDNFLVKAVKNDYRLSNGYRYVRPRSARENIDEFRDGKVGYLRYYNTFMLDSETVDENINRMRSRASNAADTRRKQAHCRKECVFAPCDLFSRKSCTSWVHSCLESELPGPFTKERIARIYRAWMKTFKRMRTPEDIAFIAYHAGEITHVFGRELTLCGMDENLEHVRFVGYRANYNKYYSFEDAVEILRTPWHTRTWHAKNGKYDRITLRDPSEMGEEALWAYAEICQRTCLPGYNYWGGVAYRYTEPRILSVEWSGFDSFTIRTHCGWDRRPHAHGVEEVARLFGIGNTIRTEAKRQALVAEDCRGSSQDTRP